MNRGEARGLIVIVCLFTTAYSLYGLFRHWHFGSSAYDLGIFDQVVWHLSRFEAPASTIRGFANIFGDHFHPMIAVWAPLYWLAPAPETLIVAQAALFAVSIVPAFRFLRSPSTPLTGSPSTPLRASRLPRGPAYALVVAYGLFWGLQRAAAFDVHEIAFAPVVIATAIVAMDRADWRLFWASVAILVLIKEDLIPLVGGFGLYLLIRGERRHGALAIAVSVAAFVTVIGFVVPAFSPSGTYAYTSAFGDVLRRPWLLPVILTTPPEKVRTAILWFAPFLFVSLASPLSILILPMAVERLLSESPNHWGTAFHYSAPLAPILAMSAGDGLARLARWLTRARGALLARRVTAGIALASVVVSAVLPGRQPLWRVFAPGHYRTVAAHITGESALAMIPASASVVAQGSIAPHLSQRKEIFMLDDKAPDAEFVITAEHLSPWPASTFDELRTLVEMRWSATHTVIFERDGWSVLQKTPSR